MKYLLRAKDARLGIISVILGTAVYIRSQGFGVGVAERFQTDPIGPTLYPAVLGICLALIGVIIFANWWVKDRKNDIAAQITGEKTDAGASSRTGTSGSKGFFKRLWTTPSGKIILAFAALFAYWGLSSLIGYLIPSLLFALFMMILLNATSWKRIAIAVLMAAFIYVVFFYLLDIPLNRGLWL